MVGNVEGRVVKICVFFIDISIFFKNQVFCNFQIFDLKGLGERGDVVFGYGIYGIFVFNDEFDYFDCGFFLNLVKWCVFRISFVINF